MLAVIGTPAGCAEYGSLAPDAPISKRAVLASGVDRFGNQCRLEHVGETMVQWAGAEPVPFTGRATFQIG